MFGAIAQSTVPVVKMARASCMEACLPMMLHRRP
jgi:hypothetical protein